jgi:succinate dehydrogenase / fumarate reductase iron-sulfur subunit
MSCKIHFKIQRFDPSKDKLPHFQEYDVELEMWNTILEGLIKIRNEIDSTLAFRMACKSGICGSCAMRINGRARLACKTKIEDLYKKYSEIIIEPLGNLKIIIDLVADMDPFYEEMAKTEPWLQNTKPSGSSENKISPKENAKIEKSGECIWCGACFSDCPSREAENKYLGPAASVSTHRFVFDPRDRNKEKRLEKAIESNIWMCAHCEKATENCPQKIDPQEIISQLREESIKQGLKKPLGAKHVLAINKSIKTYGEISEAWLPVWTLGAFGVIKETKTALKLILRKKFPPLKLKKINDFEDINKLYRKNNYAGN